MSDLVVLAADTNIEHTIRGLMERSQSLRVRPIACDIYVHPRHDPGCLNEAHDFLRPFARDYSHALVVFDHQGCGQEHQHPKDLVQQVLEQLIRAGWGDDRAEVVVLAPELEVWVWSDSPHIETCLGWQGHRPPLRQWLIDNGHWQAGLPKPDRPKEAMEAALRQVRKPRSSSIYRELAQRVSLSGHSESAFLRLVGALQRWFPQ